MPLQRENKRIRSNSSKIKWNSNLTCYKVHNLKREKWKIGSFFFFFKRIYSVFNHPYEIKQEDYSFQCRHTLFLSIYPDCQGVFQKTVDKLKIYAIHIHYQINDCKVSFPPCIWQNWKTAKYRCSLYPDENIFFLFFLIQYFVIYSAESIIVGKVRSSNNSKFLNP